MCGIVGYYQFDGHMATVDVLWRMLTAVQHRGPDMLDVFVHGPVALGNSRLSIIDLSANASLPIASSDGKSVLAYNGEIYNFRQLGVELEQAGIVFSSTSDSEVVLCALNYWGVEEAVRRFHGMFAFAYYNISEKSLSLVRDPLGIKPMYLARCLNVYVFGSEIKALLQHPSISAHADSLAIVSYMSQQRFGELETPFMGIEAILPGHIYTFTGDSQERTRYFDVEQLARPDALVSPVRREWRNEVEQLLNTSIKAHLVSDVPVAALCSGGLDSSYITAVAHQIHSAITAYVADVEGAHPEVERARRVCQYVGVTLRTVPVTENDLLRTWPEVIWWNDVPSTFMSDVPLYLVAQQCRADGIKVVLSGEGADELFCGYPWLWQADYLLRSPALIRVLSAILRPIGHRLWPWLTNLDLKARQCMAFNTIEAPDPYQPIRDAVTFSGGGGFALQSRLLQGLESHGSLVDRVINAACLNTLRGHLATLLHRTDRMGMGTSIECRVPYLHLPLMECAFNIPLALRYQDGIGKRILKEIALKQLPRDIVFAHKWGFSVSREPYRRAAEILRTGTARELLRWSNETTDVIIKELVTEKNPAVLYSLVSLDLWGRIFLCGESPADLGEKLLALGKSFAA